MHVHHWFARRSSCGIQSLCCWLESLSSVSDVTSACSVSCSSPAPFLFPTLFHQLNPSFDTSEGVPHMHVASSPPPPVLSSWPSIESTHHRLKVVYFVELTLWCLHHLEVGKWYWVEGLIFMVESEESSETFFLRLCCVADRQTLSFGWQGSRRRRNWVELTASPLNLCFLATLNGGLCKGARLRTHISPRSGSHSVRVQFYLHSSLSIHL